MYVETNCTAGFALSFREDKSRCKRILYDKDSSMATIAPRMKKDAAAIGGCRFSTRLLLRTVVH